MLIRTAGEEWRPAAEKFYMTVSTTTARAVLPVTGPKDVIGSAPVGVLSDDLQAACVQALRIERQACLDFAADHTWEASARAFVGNITQARAELHLKVKPVTGSPPVVA